MLRVCHRGHSLLFGERGAHSSSERRFRMRWQVVWSTRPTREERNVDEPRQGGLQRSSLYCRLPR